jgi:hypothetical protein
MPTILLHHAGATRALPLAASTLVGRGWACLARVRDPAVPVHWLELRWQAGWTWRVLSAEDRTHGPGAPREHGWRALPVSSPRKPALLRLGDTLSLELVEDGPPEPFLLEPATGAYLRGPELLPHVEPRGKALLPLSAEGDPAQALQEGDLLLLDGTPWRVHGVSEEPPTARGALDLARPGLRLLVDEDPLRVTLLQGETTLELRGEHLRTLLVYLRARQAAPDSGWLSPLEAWAAWRALGGNADSPQERIAWDRARLRQQLFQGGVAHVERLFESRRQGQGVQIRLGVRVAE